MQLFGTGSARVRDRVVGGQFRHLEIDQLERAFGRRGVDSGHGGHGFAAVADLVARHRIFIHRHGQDAVGMGAVGTGNDGDDARQRARARNVQTQDAAVADGAAVDAPDERIGALQVGRVACPARDLGDAVDERDAAAPRFGLRPARGAQDCASAAACTASMIFT